MGDQERIDAANSRIDRLTDWLDRLLPFGRLRPLDRIPSVKLKLSILIVAGIGITVVMSTIGLWLNIKPVWSLSLAVVVALVLVQILARGVTSPLREIARAADRMARGHLDQTVTATAADELGQLGRSFNDMAAHITELERQRGELIANVSHELRTPIAVIQGSVENLLDDVVDDQKQTLAAMLRQTERLGRLITELMDLSRIDAGEAPMDLQPMDLSRVLDRVIEETRLRDPEPKVELTAPAVIPMNGDPERLHQVVANLVDNAVRYQPDGEPIRIVATLGRHEVEVRVEDQGPGIPSEELDRIFDRFHRGDPGRASSTGGAGLGLAIARGIVELHSGTIAAENTSPRGAAMTVTLPTRR